MRNVVFYKTGKGKCPVQKFLDGLQSKQAQKVVWVLRLIEDLDILPQKFFKKLVDTENIWEIRIKVGSNIFRLLGFFDGKNNFVITHGFTKKTMKTPKKEIALAQAYKRDYFKR